MSHVATRHDAGFSAVEALIALIVAALFLFTGYQLYSVVMKDGAASRNQAQASSAAQRYLKQYAALAPATCASGPQLTDAAVTQDGLQNATVTVIYSCPAAAPSSITKVTATVTYGSEKVTHAVYAQ